MAISIVPESDDSDVKYYNMCASSNKRVYRRLIETIGSQITALKLNSKKLPNKKLLKLVGQHCHAAKYVIIETDRRSTPITNVIRSMSNLTCLTLNHLYCSEFYWTGHRFPQLETLCLDSVENMNVQLLKEFLYVNPQLKHLRVLNCSRFPLKVLNPLRNHLNRLNSLEYITEELDFTGKCIQISATNLERLKISINRASVANVLSAFSKGSKMIQSLELIMPGIIDVEDDANADDTICELEQSIRSFDKLTSLKLLNFEVGMMDIKILRRSLPSLTSLHLNHVPLREISTEDIFHVFEMFKHLTELKMENKNYQMKDDQQLNLEFHQKLVDVARGRGGTIQLEIIQPKYNILINEEKIVKNGELQYWIGCEAAASRSNVHLFDLGDNVLEKIYGYLNDHAQDALYETCIRTKSAMEDRIKSRWFTISDARTAKNLFSRFSEHITKLEIDMKTDSPSEMVKIWGLISENCSKNLVEMSINNVRVDATGSVAVEYPNLTKLKVKTQILSRTHIFPLMNCPELGQLEFCAETSQQKAYNSETIQPELNEMNPQLQFGITLNNLSIIKLNHLNANIERTLKSLDKNVCDQMQEFTAEKIEKNQMESVANIAMKFRNLTTLNIVGHNLNQSSIEYLFQNVTKLRKLTLYAYLCSYQDNFQATLQAINKNCKQLQALQLIRKDHQFDRHYISDIKRFLPNVVVSRFIYDEKTDTYEVDNYEKGWKSPFEGDGF